MSQSKSIISLAFVTLLLISLAFAAPSITNPVEGTIWNAGQTVTITWINSDTSGPPRVSIYLRKGNPNALTDVATIATDIPVDQKQVTYKIPADIVSGGDYTVGIGTAPNLNYSHQFTINGVSASSSSSGSSSGTSSATSGTSTATSSASGNTSLSFLSPAPTTVAATSSSTAATSAKTLTTQSPKSISPSATAVGNSSPSTAPNAASRAHSGYTIPGLMALLSGFLFF